MSEPNEHMIVREIDIKDFLNENQKPNTEENGKKIPYKK